MILIDSSAFIEFLNRSGSPWDRTVEELIRNDIPCALADVVLTELLRGIRNNREFHAVRDSLLSFPILSMQGVASYIHAAQIYRHCRQKGLTIRSTVDLLVAQIALDHHAALLHKDRDFPSIASVVPLKLFPVRQ